MATYVPRYRRALLLCSLLVVGLSCAYGQAAMADILERHGTVQVVRGGVVEPLPPERNKIPLSTVLQMGRGSSITLLYAPENAKVTVTGPVRQSVTATFEGSNDSFVAHLGALLSMLLLGRPDDRIEFGATPTRSGGGWLDAPMRYPRPQENLAPPAELRFKWYWDGRPTYRLLVSARPDTTAIVLDTMVVDTSFADTALQQSLQPDTVYYWTIVPKGALPIWQAFMLLSAGELARLEDELAESLRANGIGAQEAKMLEGIYWREKRVYARAYER